mgnify:CR=1 FL=1
MYKRILVSSLFLLNSNVIANEHFIANVSVFDYTFRHSDVNPSAIIIGYGSELMENVDFQFRIGTGVYARGDGTYSSYGREHSLEQIIGAYLIGRLPIESSFKPYAIIGASHLKFEYSYQYSSGSQSSSSNDISYGAGFDYNFTNSSSMTIEYITYTDNDDFQANALSVGYKLKF